MELVRLIKRKFIAYNLNKQRTFNLKLTLIYQRKQEKNMLCIGNTLLYLFIMKDIMH